MSNVNNYAVYLEVSDDNSGSGWFKDVPGCTFAGNSIEQLLVNAKEALISHFEYMVSEMKGELPLPTPDIPLESNTILAMVSIDLEMFEGSAKKVNITLPELLITQIDLAVLYNANYASRSGFIATACRNELAREQVLKIAEATEELKRETD